MAGLYVILNKTTVYMISYEINGCLAFDVWLAKMNYDEDCLQTTI